MNITTWAPNRVSVNLSENLDLRYLLGKQFTLNMPMVIFVSSLDSVIHCSTYLLFCLLLFSSHNCSKLAFRYSCWIYFRIQRILWTCSFDCSYNVSKQGFYWSLILLFNRADVLKATMISCITKSLTWQWTIIFRQKYETNLARAHQVHIFSAYLTSEIKLRHKTCIMNLNPVTDRRGCWHYQLLTERLLWTLLGDPSDYSLYYIGTSLYSLDEILLGSMLMLERVCVLYKGSIRQYWKWWHYNIIGLD